MSDWFATSSTEASAGAALDLVMPGPGGPWRDALADAVRAGRVDEAADRRQGRAPPAPRGARRRARRARRPLAAPRYDEQAIATLLRRTAAAGFVLAAQRGRRAAARAIRRRAASRSSARTRRRRARSAAAARRSTRRTRSRRWRACRPRLGDVQHAVGVRASDRIPVAACALDPPRWRSASSPPTAASCGPSSAPGARSTGWARSATAWRSATSRGSRCTPSCARRSAGAYDVAGSGVGRYELSVGGETVFDGRLELPARRGHGRRPDDPAAGGPPRRPRGRRARSRSCSRTTSAPRRASSASSVRRSSSTSRPPHGSDDEEIERAVALARDADVAVVVVGTTEEVESEGFDRDVARAAGAPGRARPPRGGGEPEDGRGGQRRRPGAAAVGRRGGGDPRSRGSRARSSEDALADVAARRRRARRPPAGHLAGERGRPAVDAARRRRAALRRRAVHRLPRVRPRRPGPALPVRPWARLHRPGATTRSTRPARSRPGRTCASRVRVTNTGGRRGREVVQLYASRPGGEVERPVRWLAGFAPVEAEPGETVTATVHVPRACAGALGSRGRRLDRRARDLRAGRGPLVRRAPALGAGRDRLREGRLAEPGAEAVRSGRP